jgi:hypothetical protein
MLDETGRFEFSGEILDLVERLWGTYQAVKGDPGDRVAQLTGLAYIVAALRQDVEGIWSQLLAAPELQGVALAELLQEEMEPLGGERAVALKAEMQRRGWLE